MTIAPVVRRILLAGVVPFLATACGESAPDSLAQRETLADGRVVVSYASSPVESVDTLVPDLRIGAQDGGGADVFGDVRSIEVGEDGTIYVLDSQASEIRAFRPDGSHLTTLSRKGKGPGEITEANGMAFAPDGTLWVNDHGSRHLIGLSKEGREVGRLPQVVPGYGYVWSGLIDSGGLFWEQWSHADDEPAMEATGLLEGTSREYFKSFDPRTETYDSVMIGPSSYRVYRMAIARGMMGSQLPFSPDLVAAADRSGNIWTATTDRYAITRMTTKGDTALVLGIEESPPLVTAEDRANWAEGMERFTARAPTLRREMERYIPEHKPLLTHLFTDDEGRLWVGRTVPPEEAQLFDVFDLEGEYLGSVRFFEGTIPIVRPVIRGGHIHAVVRDELDVPYVARAPLPAFASRRPPT